MEALTVQVNYLDNQWCWYVLRPGGGVVESGWSYSRVNAMLEGWEVAQWHERHLAAMVKAGLNPMMAVWN